MTVHGIDPGTYESAVVSWDGRKVLYSGILKNPLLIRMLRNSNLVGCVVAIEAIASYGMAVGKETFETAEWCGAFREAAEHNKGTVRRVYRREVKIHLCGTMKAKDANVAQALRDKFGEVGTKKNPGPLYGIASHLWSALAVADYALTSK